MEFTPAYKIEHGDKTAALPDGCESTSINGVIILLVDKDKRDELKKAIEEVM